MENSQGSAGAGDGANSVGSGSGGQATGGQGFGGGQGGGQQASTTHIDLTDDSLVRFPGAKEPVKYGDYYRKFQSEFTTKAQEAARARQEAQQYQQRLAEYERKEREAVARQQRELAQKGQTDLVSSLRGLQYLSGEEAARVVEHLTGQLQGYEKRFEESNAATVLLYNQLLNLAKGLNGLQAQSGQAEFSGKIGKFLKDAGLPDEAREFATELYTAYEGPNLDADFPNILKTRWQQLQTLARKAAAAEAAQRRQNPFVPGKGGMGSAAKPLNNLAKSSAKDIADAFWPTMVAGEVET